MFDEKYKVDVECNRLHQAHIVGNVTHPCQLLRKLCPPGTARQSIMSVMLEQNMSKATSGHDSGSLLFEILTKFFALSSDSAFIT
jgi:hypothetical protein